MRSIWNVETRRELVQRLRLIHPDTPPRWGRMSAGEMLDHLTATLHFAVGETSVVEPHASALLKLTPVKLAFIYLLPFPKHAPTAREFLHRSEQPWDARLETIAIMFDRVSAVAADADHEWPPHPFFGKLSRRAWGVLGYKHTDHHLRQFGV